ncbi:MAG: hypothetical protein GY845_08565 [Planctomycetes bacterium]|nr:hypothetical protein [Planctomycetota bacterium]
MIVSLKRPLKTKVDFDKPNLQVALKQPVGGRMPANAKPTEKGDISSLCEEKSVRNTFMFPAADYELFNLLRRRANKLNVDPDNIPNKSELVRAGLRALTDLSDTDFLDILSRIERLKPGAKKSID